MSSRDLLEILGSGAAFGGKARKAESEGPSDVKSTSSINFFVQRGGSKRRRASLDERKPAPTPPAQAPTPAPTVDEAGPSYGRPRRVSEKFSKLSGGATSIALFGKHRKDEAIAHDDVPADGRARSIHAEEIACFRRRMGIKVKGEEIPDPIESFVNMPLGARGKDAAQTKRTLLQNVEDSAWKEPTPIQMQAVPVLVAGRDLLAAAPTGSGKTAAFVMPMILKLGVQRAEVAASGIRGILLAPTRELAAQIQRDVVRLSRGRKLRVCLLTKAGAAKAAAAAGTDSKKALSGYDIVVSTPMRLVSLVREGAVSLASVEMVVLDEADKLFDAGVADGGSDKAFVGQVDEVLAACSHRQVQRALFSATIGQKVSASYLARVGPWRTSVLMEHQSYYTYRETRKGMFSAVTYTIIRASKKDKQQPPPSHSGAIIE